MGMRKPAQRLAELESELRALTSARNQTIAEATALIQRTNREYDRKAVKLSREIARLRAELFPEPVTGDTVVTRHTEPKKPMKQREPKSCITEADGYSAEEVAMYKELLSRKASKHVHA